MGAQGWLASELTLREKTRPHHVNKSSSEGPWMDSTSTLWCVLEPNHRGTGKPVKAGSGPSACGDSQRRTRCSYAS